VISFQPPDFGAETVRVCPNDSVPLSVSGSFASYSWSTGDTTPQITVNTPGNYTLTVTDANGCTAAKQFTVVTPDPPVYVSAAISGQDGNENGLTVVYTGSGNYEFSVDGVNFQTSAVFTNLSGGPYEIYIRDGSCFLVGPFPVFLISYPTFFTPNGDGYNETWQIDDMADIPSSEVRIFDRYGKLLYDFRGSDRGWDGEYDGRKLPSTDYWFVLRLDGGRTVRGHFSLKR